MHTPRTGNTWSNESAAITGLVRNKKRIKRTVFIRTPSCLIGSLFEPMTEIHFAPRGRASPSSFLCIHRSIRCLCGATRRDARQSVQCSPPKTRWMPAGAGTNEGSQTREAGKNLSPGTGNRYNPCLWLAQRLLCGRVGTCRQGLWTPRHSFLSTALPQADTGAVFGTHRVISHKTRTCESVGRYIEISSQKRVTGFRGRIAELPRFVHRSWHACVRSDKRMRVHCRVPVRGSAFGPAFSSAFRWR